MFRFIFRPTVPRDTDSIVKVTGSALLLPICLRFVWAIKQMEILRAIHHSLYIVVTDLIDFLGILNTFFCVTAIEISLILSVVIYANLTFRLYVCKCYNNMYVKYKSGMV